MDPRRWCVYPVSGPYLYLDMWSDLKGLLLDIMESDDFDDSVQPEDFLSLMLFIERIYMEEEQ